MKSLRVETETGTKYIGGVEEWGWQAVTGDLYFRRDGKLTHVKCKSVQEVHIEIDMGR